jgi:hypothetical protein
VLINKKNSDQRRLIEDSFLLNAPTENSTTVDIPNTTWKTIIESLFNIPFHSLKKMSFDIMSSSGLEQSLLKLDEYCVCSTCSPINHFIFNTCSSYTNDINLVSC